MLASEYPDYRGWVSGVSNSDYHSGPGVSKSTLDKIRKSVNHLATRIPETRYMLIGTAVHSGVLEPDDWPAKYYRGPACDKRTTEWRDAAKEAEDNGQTIMDPADFDKVDRMVDAVWSHKAAAELLMVGDGVAEQSLYWEDPITGILLRCRPDWWIKSEMHIVDLKTTKDASPGGFARSCANFFYDVQDAFYTDGVALTEESDDVRFTFVAVENDEPYNVGVYRFAPKIKEGGRRQYRADLAKYKRYLDGKESAGYSDNIEEIELPRYAKRG